MKNSKWDMLLDKQILYALSVPFLLTYAQAQEVQHYNKTEVQQSAKKIVKAQLINPTTVEVVFEDNQRMSFDFYTNHMFRLFKDINGGMLRKHVAKPKAQI